MEKEYIKINGISVASKLADFVKNELLENTEVDAEISKIAGPQLVVPVMNARYALNAANARWGSLYDALYGTDFLESNKGLDSHYNPFRGGKVIKYCRGILEFPNRS